MHSRVLACALGALTIFTAFASLGITTRTAAAAVDQGWGAPVPLQTHRDGDASAPAVAGNAGGAVFAAWVQSDGLRQGVWGNVFVPGGGIAGTGWGWPTRLDTSPYVSNTPAIAADNAGNAIAVWQQWDEGKGYTIHASRYTYGVGWGGAVVIDAPISWSWYPRIGWSSAGIAIAAWMEWDGGQYSVYAARYTTSGGWGTPVLLDTDTVSWAQSPDVAVDESGDAMVVWYESDGVRYNIMADRYTTGSGWLTPIQIDNSASSAYYPRVGVDGSGDAYATWFQWDGARYNAYANRFTPGGGWGTAAAIEASANSVYATAAGISISVDSVGEAIAVWGMWDGAARYNIYANRYVPGSGWGASETSIEILSDQCYAPQIAEDPSGNAMAVFYCNDFATGQIGTVWASRYFAGSGWTVDLYIQNWNAYTGHSPAVAVDATGDAVAVFVQNLNGPNQPQRNVLFSNRFTPGGGWGYPGNDPRVQYTWSGFADVPVIAVNDAGFAVAAWRQLDGPIWNGYASWYIPYSGWTAPFLLENRDVGDVGVIDAAINAQGQAIVSWAQGNGAVQSIFARTESGGGWGGVVEIDTLGTNSGNSKVAIDPSGDAVVVYTQWDGAAYSEYARRFVSGTWLVPESIEGGTGDAGVLGVSVDVLGDILTAWQQWDAVELRLYANQYTPGTGWGRETLVHASTGRVGGPIILRMNAGGAAAVGWPEFDGSYWTAWTARYTPAAGWGAPYELDSGPGDSGQITVQLDGGGNAMATWYHSNNGVWEVKESYYYVGTWLLPTRLSAGGGQAAFPDVVVSHRGEWAIGWQEWDGTKWNVVVQRFGFFAIPLGAATPLGAAYNYADGIRLGIDGAGDVFAVWREGPVNGVLTPMANRYVIRDGTPSLNVFSPAPGLYNTATMTVQGFTDPGAQVQIDGINVAVGANGGFAKTVTLPEGVHYFEVIAYNSANAYTIQYVVVTVDTTPPAVLITSPASGTLINSRSVTVTGTTDPEAALTVNGFAVTVSPSGDFSVPLALPEGPSTITAEATDPAGNTGSASTMIIVDTVPPPIVITGPADGTVTNNPNVVLTGFTDPGATVSVDGTPVTVGPTGGFSRSVALPDGPHTFDIIAVDAAGNEGGAATTVTVDTTSPPLTLTSPSDGTLTNSPVVTVSGTTEAGAIVDVNGAAAVVRSSGAFSLTVALREGANALDVTTTDAVGNAKSQTVTVTLDTSAPNLVLTTPPNVANGGFVITNNANVMIAGTTEAGATVDINGNAVTVGPTGAFTYQIGEADGYHAFTIVATDAAGNAASTTLTVAVDTQPPLLTVSAPADGLLTRTRTATVSGSAEYPGQVTVNGIAAVVGPSGAFSVPIVLAEGANTITTVATDVAGNAATDTRTVTLDTTPPSLSLASPTGGLLTRTPAVQVSGQTEIGATLTVDGIAVTVAADGSFTTTVTLAQGAHTFVVVASDPAGNTARATSAVTVDTTPPALTITSPTSGSSTSDASVVVSGTSEAGAHLVINGVAVNVASDGTFSARIALAPGSNTITATATDAAGNAATPQTVTVTYNDPVPGLRNDLTNTRSNLNTTQGDLAAARQSLSSLGTEALGLLALAAVALVLGVLQFVQIRGLRKQMMRASARESEPKEGAPPPG